MTTDTENTAETNLYLDPGKPTYLGGMLEFHNTTVYQPWASLTEGAAPRWPRPP